MSWLRRVLTWVTTTAAAGVVWWVAATPLQLWAKVLTVVACVGWGGYLHALPRLRRAPELQPRLARLRNGYELTLTSGVAALASLSGWSWLGATGAAGGQWVAFTATIVVGTLLLFGLAAGGLARVLSSSRNVPLSSRVLIVAFWWLPPVTAPVAGRICRTAALEYQTASTRLARNQLRASEQVCRTRYPILLVHGIFFRDWEAFNYWGRIPGELTANGATLYYGGQQSSGSVAACGAELAATISRITAETGCGKLNVIAHSKGGLDARYAISRLGAAPRVASLTTVNTPHHGCNFARELMQRIPQRAIGAVGDRYDAIFTKLGDPDPGFLAGVADLTDTECARLNELMPDAPGVSYFSVGSRMASALASPFPLNLGYTLIRPLEGPNDGLVATASMPWGTWLGLAEPTGSRGISHGDMIDLSRADIGDFDVCEFYVGLVNGLRSRGL